MLVCIREGVTSRVRKERIARALRAARSVVEAIQAEQLPEGSILAPVLQAIRTAVE
jgi:hypothetical protein